MTKKTAPKTLYVLFDGSDDEVYTYRTLDDILEDGIGNGELVYIYELKSTGVIKSSVQLVPDKKKAKK